MMGRISRMSGALVASFLLACGGGDQQGAAGTGDTASGRGPTVGAAPGDEMNDSTVFAALTAANAAEIQAGQLAADSATNQQVKQFGQLMVTEHRAMNEQAHQAAQQANVVSQAGPGAEQVGEMGRAMMQELQGKRGAEFDRAFMDAMVRSHQETLDLLTRATQGANLAAPLRNVVTQAQPKVQQHLDQARQIQQQLQGS